MSRIGKQPVTVPSGVEVKIDGLNVTVKGQKGSLQRTFRYVGIEQAENALLVKQTRMDRQGRAFHGLARALLNNMVVGVSQGFSRKLEIVGTGYRAAVKGKSITLNVGFSHPVEIGLPEGVNASVENNTLLILEGANNETLGQLAATIRRVRPPEPYKGKGIRYQGESILRKAGKTGK